MENSKAYSDHQNGNSNYVDPNDMATDEDAIERKKVSINLIDTFRLEI